MMPEYTNSDFIFLQKLKLDITKQTCILINIKPEQKDDK